MGELRNDSEGPLFGGTACKLIAYEVELAGDQFDFDALARSTGWDKKRKFRNTCSSHYPSSDYHLHLNWRLKPPDTVAVTMEFVFGQKTPDEGEKEPFAEEFIGWFGKFIKAKEVSVDMYADFDYPSRPSTMLRFPLPMRAPVGPLAAEVEIDGISFKIFPPVNGVKKAWITQSQDNVNIHIHAAKVLNVASLDPREQVLEIAHVLDSIFDQKAVGSKQ